MLKGGATADGAKAAMSHTASLGSDDRILDGAMRQAGIVRIEEFTHLFIAAKAAAMMPLPAGNRVGFVSPSGAFIVHASDICRQRTILEFPKVTRKTQARLEEISPPFINITNPVDVFPSATVHGMEFAWREAMLAVLMDPNVDSVISILILADELGEMKLDFIVDLARQFPEKPIYISFSGDEGSNAKAKAFLEPQGVPTFPRIEDPFKVLDVLARARAVMKRR
jgi:acyl-CoA synthetase (NDP forming)